MTLFEYAIGITGLISFAASHVLVGVMQTRRRVRRNRIAPHHS